MRIVAVALALVAASCGPAADLPEESTMSGHAVIVRFDYKGTDLQPIYQLEDRLEAAVAAAGVGEYDGNEVAVDGSGGFLYLYGTDGDSLFAVVRPILESAAFMRGATVTVRYGPPGDGVKEKQVMIGP